jgi:hypothetical protein
MTPKNETWLRGLIAKRPAETLQVLAALCDAGLARGEVSANDLGDREYSHPNVIGGAFKLMKRIGFVKTDRIIASTRPRSHGSFVLTWRLEDGSKATAFLNECRAVLLKQEQKEVTQALLPL